MTNIKTYKNDSEAVKDEVLFQQNNMALAIEGSDILKNFKNNMKRNLTERDRKRIERYLNQYLDNRQKALENASINTNRKEITNRLISMRDTVEMILEVFK